MAKAAAFGRHLKRAHVSGRWLLALGVCTALVAGVRAQPSSPGAAVQDLRPGETLRVRVELASGITPPPGVQQDRALARWHLDLFSRGTVGWGAPAQAHIPLRVSNVRPLAANTRGYVAEAALPVWVAPGRYTARLRFAGRMARESEVEVHGCRPGATARPEAEGMVLSGPPGSCARLHVSAGHRYRARDGAIATLHPLVSPAGGLASAALLCACTGSAGAGRIVRERVGHAWQPRLQLPLGGRAGEALPLAVSSRDVKRAVWWLDDGRGAVGTEVRTQYVAPGRYPVAAFASRTDGGFGVARGYVHVSVRRQGGCTVSHGGHWGWLGLLLGLSSGKLGLRRRGISIRRTG